MDGFKTLISQPSIKSILNQAMPEHRERVFTPLYTLYMFNRQIMRSNKSCRGTLIEVLPEHFIERREAYFQRIQELIVKLVSDYRKHLFQD